MPIFMLENILWSPKILPKYKTRHFIWGVIFGNRFSFKDWFIGVGKRIGFRFLEHGISMFHVLFM